jgi:hypothetical protein
VAKIPVLAAIAGILVAASPSFAAVGGTESALLSLRASNGLTDSPSTLTAEPGGPQLISDKKSSKKRKKKQKGKAKKNKKSDDKKSSKSKSKSKSDSESHDRKDDHGNHANDPSHT